MPVAENKEIHAGRDFGIDLSDRSYTQVFMVRTTQKHDEGFVISEAAAEFGTPVMGEGYFKDEEAKCFTANGVQTSGPYWWTLTFGFSTTAKALDPLDDPVIITWEDVFRTEHTQLMANGKVMTNSAHEAYDKPIALAVVSNVLHLMFNVSGEDPPPKWMHDLSGDADFGRHTVNDRDVLIDRVAWGKGEVRCDRISLGDVKTRNRIKYRVINVQLATNGNGWAIDRLDEGFNEEIVIDDEDTAHRPIRLLDGSLPAKPRPLDGNGKALPGKVEVVDFVFNSHVVYTSADHTQIKGVEDDTPTLPGCP